MTNRNLHVESLTEWWEFLKQYYSTELKKKETTWLFDWQNQPGLTFDPLFTCKNCKNFNPSCWINLSQGLPNKGGWHEDSWKTPIRLTETLTLTRQQPLSTFSIWKLKIKTKFNALNCLITLGFNLLLSIQCVCVCRYHLKLSSGIHIRFFSRSSAGQVCKMTYLPWQNSTCRSKVKNDDCTTSKWKVYLFIVFTCT